MLKVCGIYTVKNYSNMDFILIEQTGKDSFAFNVYLEDDIMTRKRFLECLYMKCEFSDFFHNTTYLLENEADGYLGQIDEETLEEMKEELHKMGVYRKYETIV